MNILLLKGFNNYFNRIVKKHTNIADYKSAVTSYLDYTGINFNPNDGVMTNLVIGSPTQLDNSAAIDWETLGTPDYLVCYEMEGNPLAAVIKSRWFILEIERTRNGQYKLTIKRDVVADNYDNIVSAPCFIKRAMIDETNPFILNSEGMLYNQIKKSELQLTDLSETPWIVGYINKKSLNTFTTRYTISSNTGSHTFSNIDTVESVMLHSNDSSGNEYDITLNYKGTSDTYGYTFDPNTHILTWNIAQTLLSTSYLLIEAGASKNITITTYQEPASYVNAEDLPWDFDPNATALGKVKNDMIDVDMFGWNKINATTGRQVSFGAFLNKDAQGKWVPISSSSIWASAGSVQTADNSAWYPIYSSQYDVSTTSNLNSFISNTYSALANPSTEATITDIDIAKILADGGLSYCAVDPSSYNNKLVKYNGYYYQISIGAQQEDYHTYEFTQATDAVNGLYSKIHANYSAIAGKTWPTGVTWTEQDGSNASLNAFRGTFYSQSYPITITPYALTAVDVSIKIPASGIRNTCLDAPYDIFAIPFNRVEIKTAQVNTDIDITQQLVQKLALELGSNLYDIQLLPYCPILNVPYAAGKIQEIGSEGINYTYIKDSSNNIKNIVYFCSTSKATFDIDVDLHIYAYTLNSSINKKIDSETVFYRLVSPNYNGQFEFKVANNNAAIDKVNIDLEYKPFVPYIHVSPVWNNDGLYGGDYNDARGLICGGDFSLPIVNDAWKQYQIQNKNYQNIFDRQIQNMNTQHALMQRSKDLESIIGTVTAPIAGAAVGSQAGPWGALAGAGIGAVTGLLSQVGRGIDTSIENQALFEKEGLAKDTFRYNLQNIQALPYSISKVSSFNNNNKIFPFIEKYEATSAEVNALIEKINYTSMELGVVSTISNYIVSGNKYFISGDIIRLDNITEDSHMAEAIYLEINKGVYM